MHVYFLSEPLGGVHTRKTKTVLINLQNSFEIHFITFLKGLPFLNLSHHFYEVSQCEKDGSHYKLLTRCARKTSDWLLKTNKDLNYENKQILERQPKIPSSSRNPETTRAFCKCSVTDTSILISVPHSLSCGTCFLSQKP